MALQRRMTIVELLIDTIYQSYRQIERLGIYPKDSYEQERIQDSTFKGLINGEIKGFFRTIIQFNKVHVKGTFVERKLK